MIQVSRTRRQAVEAMGSLVLLAAVILPNVDCGKACPASLCTQGLTLSFDGWFESGKSYDIDVTDLTRSPAGVPLVSCSIDANVRALRCSSERPLTNLGGGTIVINDRSFRRIKVSLATEGALIAEREYQVAFETVGDSSCGFCTGATVSVDLPAKPAGLVWEPFGSGVTLSCVVPGKGLMGFEASREQLTAEQLAGLAGLEVLERPVVDCSLNQAGCSLFVTYDGLLTRSAVWSANPDDRRCDDAPTPMVSFASLAPFVEATGCPYSENLSRAAAGATTVGAVPLIKPAQTCQTSVTATQAGGTFRFGLVVPAPTVSGARLPRVEVADLNYPVGGGPSLGERVATKLYEPAGMAVLAEAASSSSGRSTQTIDHAFSQAGTYVLELVVAPANQPRQTFGITYR